MLLYHLQRWYYRHKSDDPAVNRLFSSPAPKLQNVLAETDCLAVDLETTSLEPAEGEIASIGWVPIINGAIQLSGAEQYFLSIHEGVGQSAIYHQISDSDLSQANSHREVLEHFLAIAAGKVLVFHFADLDMGFLNQSCRKLFGVPLIIPWIDTMRLEKRKLLKEKLELQAGELRLFACRERYGLPEYPAHDALTDAIATAELLLAHTRILGINSGRRPIKLKQLV